MGTSVNVRARDPSGVRADLPSALARENIV